MGNLKIGDLEGEAQDIEGIFQRNGLSFKDYIAKKPQKKEIHFLWLIVTVVLFFGTTCSIWIKIFDGNYKNISVLADFFLLCILLVTVHLKFDNNAVTAICAIFGFVVIAICLGAMTPEQGIKNIQDNMPKLQSRGA